MRNLVPHQTVYASIRRARKAYPDLCKKNAQQNLFFDIFDAQRTAFAIANRLIAFTDSSVCHLSSEGKRKLTRQINRYLKLSWTGYFRYHSFYWSHYPHSAN